MEKKISKDQDQLKKRCNKNLVCKFLHSLPKIIICEWFCFWQKLVWLCGFVDLNFVLSCENAFLRNNGIIRQKTTKYQYWSDAPLFNPIELLISNHPIKGYLQKETMSSRKKTKSIHCKHFQFQLKRRELPLSS